MTQHTQLISHIESFVDSSSSPSHQAASVNSIASFLKNDAITLEYLVREMEMYLTTTDHILRARGMLLLAEVLVHLQLKPLSSTTIHTLVGFFTERLTDWRALHGALVGCLALLRRKSNVGIVAGSDAKALAQSYLENLQVQSLGQHDRKICFELLECLLDGFPEDISMLGDHLLYGICEAIEGEKDPECLIHAFHIVEILARVFPDPDGPIPSFSEDLFGIIGQYFPIHYTHPKSEDVNVSREDLSRALMLAFSASPFFEPFSIPLLLEKLSSALPLAKLDSLKYLSYCAMKYGPTRIAKHAEAIWSSLRSIIYYFQEEHSLSSLSDLANGKGFQENEITKEALVLLQTVISQENNGFLDLVINDQEINNVVISLADSETYKDSARENEQRVFAVGCVLSVLAKASTASCNIVFETVFVPLLNTLGIHSNKSPQDASAIHTNDACQKLNFFAIYICIQILSASRELAVCSVKRASNCNFVEDRWSQMLSSFSGSLMKAFSSNLITSSSSTETYDDADFSLRVKGLQDLASFPGGYFPVSKAIFENTLKTLISIVTENFELTPLWKVSLNALAKIGVFLEEHPNPDKSQSYLSNVVERLISLILMDDHTMHFPLILEAISEIGASGHMFMLSIVRGVQEAISAKFSKIDGDVNVAAKLVQLLECYCSTLLPWVQKFEGSKDVPLCFAMNIWDQIEQTVPSSHILGENLIKATMTALKLAVAICSEEDQSTVFEKAFGVMLSNESSSQNPKSSQFEGLRITQDTNGFICRDECLVSLFASVVIALRPKTKVSNLRAVIHLLLTAYLKGNETSAQALGSIVNKMPPNNVADQNSSNFSLDNALDLIFETSLGRCNMQLLSTCFEADNHNELNLTDSALYHNQCISGFAWIGKGLLMRGHDKVKEITMVLLKCLISSGERKTSSEKQSPIPKAEEVNLIPSVRKYAADAFHILMRDSEECLNKTFHAIVRPLYKQRFFSTVMPILLSAAMKFDSLQAMLMLYRAVGHVISDTPLAAVLTENKKLLPVLLDVISALSEDNLNKDMVYNLLLVLSGILMDKKGQDAALENVHVIVNCLTKLLLYPHKMVVRETTVQCLAAMSGMPHRRIYPMRTQVLNALSKALDDPKRAVRQEAVRCRQAWASIV